MSLKVAGRGGVLSLTRCIAESFGKRTAGEAWKAGAWKMLIDGQLA